MQKSPGVRRRGSLRTAPDLSTDEDAEKPVNPNKISDPEALASASRAIAGAGYSCPERVHARSKKGLGRRGETIMFVFNGDTNNVPFFYKVIVNDDRVLSVAPLLALTLADRQTSQAYPTASSRGSRFFCSKRSTPACSLIQRGPGLAAQGGQHVRTRTGRFRGRLAQSAYPRMTRE